jgi:hypothetical protein
MDPWLCQIPQAPNIPDLLWKILGTVIDFAMDMWKIYGEIIRNL